MTRSTLPRVSAAAMALALASLAACGGDDGERDGGETSAESSSPSTDVAEGVDAEAGEEIAPDEFVDLYVDAMDKATTASFEMTFGGSMAVTGSGVADFSETPPAMNLTLTDANTEQGQEMILVDGIMYLRLPDKSYMKYDLTDPNGLLGSDLTEQLDPSAMADVFEKGITDSLYLGEEDVDGEAMEHYRLELDSAVLLEEAELPSAAPSDAIAEDITFDLWFDDDGYFRRQDADLGGSAGTVELSYDNWGEPVEITAPPKAKLKELPGA